MLDRISIEDLSRQPLVRGTSCFTDPAGEHGYKTEDVQASALVRIAAALEQGNQLRLATRAGFDQDQTEDGQNHFHLVYEKGYRVFSMQVLASSPEKAVEWVDLIRRGGQELVAAANDGRAMRLTATLAVPTEHQGEFARFTADFNKKYPEKESFRVYVAAFTGQMAQVRYAEPEALFLLGQAWTATIIYLGLEQEGGPADA